MSKESKIIGAIIAVVVVVVGIGLLLMRSDTTNGTQPTPAANNTEALNRPTPHVRGKQDSSVTVVEFADMQCPACAGANPAVNALYAEYKDRVKFVFRHYPLDMHRNAPAGAEAVEAAAEQNKFWEMVDELYARQPEWETLQDPKPVFRRIAANIGLDPAKFDAALGNQSHRDRIAQDKADGNALDIPGTPTFYVNGERIFQDGIKGVKEKIDAALANPEATESSNNSGSEITAQSAPFNSGQTSGGIFGFIKSVTTNPDTDNTTIIFDEARFLTGEAAEAAAKTDQGCSKPNPPSDCSIPNAFTPNGFYIQNTSKATKNYGLALDATIKLIQLGSDPGVGIKTASKADMHNILVEDSKLADYAGTPFWIKIDGDTITYIEQQYLP